MMFAVKRLRAAEEDALKAALWYERKRRVGAMMQELKFVVAKP